MRILGIRTHYQSSDGKKRLSAVDWWRVQNPLQQLAKHGHTVSFVDKVVDENQNETVVWENIGHNFDIIFTSYIDDPKQYAYLRALRRAYGTVHIMDLDDDILSIDEMNPARLRYAEGSKPYQTVVTTLRDVDYLTVTTPRLQEKYSLLRGGKSTVTLPNFIDPETYQPEKAKPKRHKGVVIGYQGSATHFSDIFKTGFIWAIRRIIKEFDNVRFAVCGTAFEELYLYLPKKKVIVISGDRDFIGWTKVWQKLPFDIGVAPLISTDFNRCKSSIKFYEYSLRKIPGVYSFTDSYLSVIKEGENGFLARDGEEWYEALKKLIVSKPLRDKMARKAYKDVMEKYTIQKHWQKWDNFFKRVWKEQH